MKALRRKCVHEHLPPSVGVEWSGLLLCQEKHEGGKTGFVLALAFLFVFAVPLPQSARAGVGIPVAVLLSLPVAGTRGLHGHLAVRPRE